MASELLIQPLALPSTEFPSLPLNPGFAQLAADTLGDAGSDADGFAEVFADAVSVVDGLDAALSGLGSGLVDAFGEADTIDPAPVAGTVQSFTGSVAHSTAAAGAVDALHVPALGSNPLNLGAYVKQFYGHHEDVTLPSVKAGSKPYTATAKFTNSAPFSITIGPVTLEGATNVFTKVVSITPDPWAASATLTVVMAINPAVAGTYTADIKFGVRGPSYLSLAGLTYLVRINFHITVTP